jgi:hypothetical protein
MAGLNLDPVPEGSYIPSTAELGQCFQEQINHHYATSYHIAVVTLGVADMALKLGLGDRIEQIAAGGLLHDYGKITVPSWCLLVSRNLVPPEFLDKLKDHEDIGYNLLRNRFGKELDPNITNMIRYHHGQSGVSTNTLTQQTPPTDSVPAKSLAVVDAFSAIIDPFLGAANGRAQEFRPYAKFKTPRKAFKDVFLSFHAAFSKNRDARGFEILDAFTGWYADNFDSQDQLAVPNFISNGSITRFYEFYAPEFAHLTNLDIVAAKARIEKAFSVVPRREP